MTEKKKTTDNLALRFLSASEKFKDKPFLRYEISGGENEKRSPLPDEKSSQEEIGKTTKTLSYGQFIGMAKVFAGNLRRRGVRPGMKIGLFVPSGPGWCLVFTASVLAGAIAVPINEAAAGEDLRAVFADCRPEAIVVNGETKKHIFSFSSSPSSEPGYFSPIVIDMEAPGFFVFPPEAPLPPSSAQPDEPAMIIYTSGTTGLQKGVTLTHRNLISDAVGVIETGVVGEKENLLLGLPFYHSYPVMCFIASFMSGASLTLLASLKDLARVAKACEVTIIVAVPQMLELLDASIKKRLPCPAALLLPVCGGLRRKTGINLGRAVFRKAHSAFGGSLRLIASGGARLAPDVMLNLEAVGFTIVEGYGLTETSPIVTFNPVKKRKPGSAGKPVGGAEVRIKDGEVQLRGPMLMQGYWKKPEETARAVEDGWLHTGDTGWVDDEGYLFLTGRKKEILVLSSGKNIVPEEVEKRYSGKSPLIKDIAVYEEGGVLKGVIVPELDYAREKGLASLREETGWELMRIGQDLPSFMRLKGFSLVKGPLPKTPLGKVKRYRLGELLKKEEAAQPRQTGPEFLHGHGQKTAHALNMAAGRKSGTAIRAEDNLELDLGMDSLKRIELIAALEDEFSLSTEEGKRALPDDFLLDVQTAGELLKKMEGFLFLQVAAGQAGPVSGAGKRPLPPVKALPFKEGETVSFSPAEKAASVLLYFMFKGLAKVLFRLKGKGLQNMPAPPFILAPNHSSFLDAFVIAASLPLRTVQSIFFVGWERYFRGVIARTLRVIHVIPIDREHLLGGALRSSSLALRQGYSLCVFPEGGRSFDGRLMELKPGIAVMAANEGVPIVPAWIEGAARALPRGGRVIRPVRIEVRFGKPLYPGDFESNDKLLAALANSLNALSLGEERS